MSEIKIIEELLEIRNRYSLSKIENCNDKQICLLKYDELCVKLIKENQHLKERLQQAEEVIEKVIKFINDARYDKELKTIAYGGLNVNGINKILDILNEYKKEV